jgi:hypothetical protein
MTGVARFAKRGMRSHHLAEDAFAYLAERNILQIRPDLES